MAKLYRFLSNPFYPYYAFSSFLVIILIYFELRKKGGFKNKSIDRFWFIMELIGFAMCLIFLFLEIFNFL